LRRLTGRRPLRRTLACGASLCRRHGHLPFSDGFWLRVGSMTIRSVSQVFTFFLKSAPTENLTAFEAGMCTGSPVRGLRPVRAERSVRDHAPKPGSVTLSPPETARCTTEMNALTAFSASDLPMPASPATLSTSSDLFTLPPRVVRVL